MSWAVDEWKVGLDHRTLTKISEIENQNDKLRKETKQKQFQLESLEAAFGKQKQKTEEEKSHISGLKRENGTLAETCAKLEQKVDKLDHEMHNKDTLLSSLKDQLQRCKRQMEQNASKASKSQKKDESQQQIESLSFKISELQSLLAKEKCKTESLGKQLSDSMHTKVAKKAYIPSLPWAIDDNILTPEKKSKAQPAVDLLTGSPLALSGQGAGDNLISLLPSSSQSTEVENLRSKLEKTNKLVMEMESKLQSEGKDLRAALREKETVISKLKDEAAKTQNLLDQANGKVAELDRRLKQVCEELNCERHNADASRTLLQNKLHEEEKSKKKELSAAQDSIRSVEKQLEELKAKHAQEQVQLKNEVRCLQSDLDKTCLNRTKLESELKKIENQLLQAEQVNQASSNKTSELNAVLKEADQANMHLSASLEKAKRDLTARDADLKQERQLLQTAQNKLTDTHRLLNQKEKEWEDVKMATEARSKTLGNNMDNLKLQLADLESKKKSAEDLIKRKEREISELSNKLSNMEKDTALSLQKMEKSQKEVLDLTKEKNVLVNKNETVVTQLQNCRKELEELKAKCHAEVLDVKLKLENANDSHQKAVEALRTEAERDKDELRKKDLNERSRHEKAENDFTETISKLKSQLNDETQKLHHVTDELTSLKTQVNQKDECTIHLKKNLQELKCKEETLSTEVGELRKKLEAASQLEKELLEAKNALEEKHKNLVVEAREDSIERKSLEGRVQDLEAQVESLKQEQHSIDSLSEELEETRANVTKLNDQLANAHALSQSQVDKILRLEAEVNSAHLSLDKVVEEKEEAAVELKELTSCIEGKIADYETKLSKAAEESRNLQTECNKLRKEHEASCAEAENLYDQLQEVKSGKQELAEKVAVAEQMVADANSRLSSTLSHCTARENEIKKLQRSNDEKASELGLARAAYSEMKMRSELLSEKLNVANSEKSEFELKVKELEKNCEELATQKSSLDAKLVEAVADAKMQVEALNAAVSQKSEDLLLSRAQCEKLQSEGDALLVSLEEADSEKREGLECASRLRDNISALKQTIQDKTSAHEAAVKELRDSIASSEQETVTLREEVESMKLSLEAEITEKQKLGQVAEERMSKILSIEKDLSASKDQRDVLSSQLETAQQRLRDMEIGAEKSSVEIATLQQCVEGKKEVIGQLSSEIAEMQADFSDKMKALEVLHCNLKKDFDEACYRETKLEEVTSSLKVENKQLKERLEKVELELGKAQGDAELLQMDLEDKDEMIAAFQNVTMPNMEALLATARERIQSNESELSSLKDKIIELNQQLADAEEDNKTSLDQLTVKSEEAERIQIAYVDLQEQVQAREVSLSAARDQLDTLQAAYTSLEDEKKRLACEFEALSATVEQHETMEHHMKTKLTSVEEECRSLESTVESLESDNDELVAQLKSLETSASEFKLQNENLQKAVKEDKERYKASKSSLEEDLKCALAEMNSCKVQLQQNELAMEQTQSLASNLEGLCDRLSNDNSALREDNERLTQDLQNNQTVARDLQEQVRYLEKSVGEVEKTYSQRVATLRKTLETMQKEQSEHSKVVARLNEKLSEKDDALDDEKKRSEILQQKVANLEEMQMKLREKTLEAEAQRDELEQVNKQVSAEVEGFRQTVKNLQEEMHEKMLEKDNQIRSLESTVQVNACSRSALEKDYNDALARLQEEISNRLRLDAVCKSLELKEESLSQAAVTYEQKINDLQNHVDKLELASAEISKQHDSTLLELEAARKSMSESSEKSNATFSALQVEVAELAGKLAALRDASSVLETTCADQSTMLRDTEAELNEKSSKLEELTKLHDAALAEKAGLTKEIACLLTKTEDLSSRLEQSELALEKAKCELSDQLAQQKLKSDEVVASYSAQIASLNADISELQRGAEEKTASESLLDQRVAVLQQDLKDANIKTDALNCRNHLLENEKSSLTAELSDVLARLQSESEEKANALSSLEQLQMKSNEKSRRADDLEEDMKSRLREYQDSAAESSLKVRELAASLKKRGHEIEGLSHELESAEEQLRLRNATIENLKEGKLQCERQLLESQDSLSVLTKQSAEQTHELELLRKKHNEQLHDNTCEAQNLRSQVSELTAALQDKEKERLSLAEKLLASNELSQQKIEELAEVNQQLVIVQANCAEAAKNSEEHASRFKMELSAAEERLKEKAMLLDEAQSTLERERKEKKALADAYEQTIGSSKDEDAQHLTQLKALQQALEAAGLESEKLSLQVEEERRKKSSLECDLSACKDDLQARNSELVALETKIAETSRVNKELLESNEILDCKLRELDSTLEAKAADAQAFDLNIAKLRDEKESLIRGVARCEEEIGSLRTQVEEGKQRSSDAFQRGEDTQRLNFKLESDVGDLTQRLDAAEQKLRFADQAREAEILRLEEAVAEMQKEAEQTVDKHADDLACKSQAIEKLTETVSSLRSELCQESAQRRCVESERETLKEKVSHLEEALEKKELECQSLLGKSRNLERQCSDAQEELSRFQARSSEEKDKIVRWREECDSWQKRYEGLKDAKAEALSCLERQCVELKDTNTVLKAELDSERSKADERATEVNALKGKLEQSAARLEAEKTEASTARTAHKLAEAEALTCRSQLSDAQTLLEDLQEQICESDSKVSTMRAEHAERLEKLQRTLTAMQDEISMKENEAKQLKDELHCERLSKRDFETKLNTAEKQVKQAAKLLDEYREAQRESFDAAALAERELQQVRHEWELEAREKQDKLEKVQSQLEGHKSQLNTYVAELAEQRLTIQDLQSRCDRLQQDSDSSEREREAAESSLETLRDKLVAAEDRLSESRRELSAAEATIGEKERRIAELADENELLEKQGTAESNDLKQKVEALNWEIAKKNEHLENERRISDDLRREHCELEQAVSAKMEELSMSRETVQALSNDVEHLKCAHDSLQEEKDSLSGLVETLEREKANLVDEMSDLLGDSTCLKERLAEKEKESCRLREKLDVVEGVLDEAQAANKQMSSQLNRLNEVIAQETTNFKRKYRRLEHDNELLSSENEKLKDQLMSTSQRVASVDDDMVQMKARHAKTEALCSELLEEKQLTENSKQELADQLAALKEEHATLRLAYDDVEGMLQELGTDTEGKQKQLEKAECLLRDSQQAMDSLRQKLREEREKVNEVHQNQVAIEVELKEEISELHAEVERLSTAAAEAGREVECRLEKRMQQAQAHSRKLASDFEILNQQAVDSDALKSQLEIEVLSLKSEIKELEKRHHADKEVTARFATAKVKAMFDDLEEMKVEVEKSDAEKLELRNEIERLQRKADGTEDVERINVLEADNVKLSKELDQMKAKLQLMTGTARKKEKQLLRLQELVEKSSTRSNPLSETRGSRDRESMRSQNSLTSASSQSQGSTDGVAARRRSARNRNSFGKTPMKDSSPRPAVNPAPLKKTPPKKSKLSDESSLSASPVYQVEGLPHLVNQGFTNIPLGFSSPFVMRRQQLSQTTHLVAAAMAKNKGVSESQKQSEASSTNSAGSESSESTAARRVQTRSRSRKSQEAARPRSRKTSSKSRLSLETDPLATVTNSPTKGGTSTRRSTGMKPLTRAASSPGTRSRDGNEGECKVQ